MLFTPAATGFLSAVVNAGHDISSVPAAGAPSARYTVSLILVVAGVAALLTSTISINTSPKLNSRTLRQPTCNMNPPLTRTSKPELLKANSYPPQFYLVILSEAKDPIPVRAMSAGAGNSLLALLRINMPNLAPVLWTLPRTASVARPHRPERSEGPMHCAFVEERPFRAA